MDLQACSAVTLPGLRQGRTSGVEQVGNDLEGVALVDQELLPLGAIVHLLQRGGMHKSHVSIAAKGTNQPSTRTSVSPSGKRPWQP